MFFVAKGSSFCSQNQKVKQKSPMVNKNPICKGASRMSGRIGETCRPETTIGLHVPRRVVFFS